MAYIATDFYYWVQCKLSPDQMLSFNSQTKKSSSSSCLFSHSLISSKSEQSILAIGYKLATWNSIPLATQCLVSDKQRDTNSYPYNIYYRKAVLIIFICPS